MLAENGVTQFVTQGGAMYWIWATTDATNDLACTIHVEPRGFAQSARAARTDIGNGPRAFCDATPREAEIIQLVAEGYTNMEIADELCISLSTVKSHIQRIFEKYNVSNRAMLVRRYYGSAA